MPTVLEQLSSAIADRYRIEREIGAGGMATVYLAHDLKHDRPVAVKVLHPELSAVLGADRFLTEIKTTAALQHPHILPLFDSGSANGLLFYVMPLIDGETLRQRLEREKQLPVKDAIRISKEVASALDYAHRRGVIHRDIKPENILLHDGQALVADFGIALAVQSAGGARITQTGLSLGTPQYMSPEQAMGERDITARSDVYSLGAVAYEMLVGAAPFTGPTAQSIVAKVMTEDPAPITRNRKTVPLSAESAILTALQKLPADRFGTTAEFAAALDIPSTGEQPSTGAGLFPGTRTLRFSSPVIIAGGIALLALGVLAGKMLGGGKDDNAIHFTAKTFRDLSVFNARVAPDGQTIVYSGTAKAATPDLFVVRPDYLDSRPLGLNGTHLLSVSSKGELAVLVRASYIGFRLFSGTLARVPLGGGAPREMMERIREADWSPDGSQLAVIHDLDGEDRLEYPIGTTLVKTAGYFSDPRISPDGSRIAFIDHPFRFDDRGYARVVDLKGKEIAKSAEYGAVQGMAWLNSGESIAFSAADGVDLVVHLMNMKSHERTPLPLPGNNTILDITADGRWLVATDRRSSLLFGRAAGTAKAVEMGWLDYSFTPQLSHDGKQLAFGDANSTLYSTILRPMGGGEPTRLGDGMPLAFTPDGQWVVALVPTSPAKLVMYPTRAGAERVVPTGKIDQITSVSWFPDGTTLLVCGNEKAKPPTCGSLASTGGEWKPLTPAGTAEGKVSPDGREILARDADQVVKVYRIGGNDPPLIVPMDSSERMIDWSPTGRGVVTTRRVGVDAVRIDLGTGVREVLVNDPVDLTGISVIRSLALADDPRVYAYVARTQKARLYFVEGFK